MNSGVFSPSFAGFSLSGAMERPPSVYALGG